MQHWEPSPTRLRQPTQGSIGGRASPGDTIGDSVEGTAADADADGAADAE